MKLLLVGHARHGKDAVADLLAEAGLKKADSSRRAAEIFLFEKLRSKYGYTDFEECYQDRVNHRAEWYDEIKAFNTPDLTRLARNIMADSDIYVGMRDYDEINACVKEGIFDVVIWVDGSERQPLEPRSSFNIDKSVADLVIDNNGPEENLKSTVAFLYEYLQMRFGL